jgi:carboxypeptidase C (cathepsin A)
MHHALDHMTLDASYRTNITYEQYEAGHMMYVNLPDLQKMHADLERFIQQ